MRKKHIIPPDPYDIDPDVERMKMAREIRREHWRNQFDLGFAPRGAVRSKWVDHKLREEELL